MKKLCERCGTVWSDVYDVCPDCGVGVCRGYEVRFLFPLLVIAPPKGFEIAHLALAV